MRRGGPAPIITLPDFGYFARYIFDHPGKAAGKASPVPVLLITYATHEDAVHRALAAVQRDKVISGRPQVIRIEKN